MVAGQWGLNRPKIQRCWFILLPELNARFLKRKYHPMETKNQRVVPGAVLSPENGDIL